MISYHRTSLTELLSSMNTQSSMVSSLNDDLFVF